MDLASNFFSCDKFQVNSYSLVRLITIVAQVYNFPKLHYADLSLTNTFNPQGHYCTNVPRMNTLPLP